MYCTATKKKKETESGKAYIGSIRASKCTATLQVQCSGRTISYTKKSCRVCLHPGPICRVCLHPIFENSVAFVRTPRGAKKRDTLYYGRSESVV